MVTNGCRANWDRIPKCLQSFSNEYWDNLEKYFIMLEDLFKSVKEYTSSE